MGTKYLEQGHAAETFINTTNNTTNNSITSIISTLVPGVVSAQVLLEEGLKFSQLAGMDNDDKQRGFEISGKSGYSRNSRNRT